ncbi:MAG: carbamoyltransferase HypF [Desulfobulbales bacterium]|nr:carbamoyltransferase HypF [Desulfobulbales bacterium]
MADNLQRRRIVVNGIVQGVGFRPFVYNLARRYGLVGTVSNTSAGVEIEIEGIDLDRFENSLKNDLPPQAVLSSFATEVIPLRNYTEFSIGLSRGVGRVSTQIAPDLAVCPDCLRELFDPDDRRYLYPFINCTNCGPRYSIVTGIPYDREKTAMRRFEMCDDCRAEYEDPADRRFHAQPNGCPECGPRISLCGSDGREIAGAEQVVARAAGLLRDGGILAVKGLGGFHLACDARNEETVRLLRHRKNREEKPLAVMAADLEMARRLCRLDRDEEGALLSPAAPIVVAAARGDNGIAPSVAPFTDKLGVMVSYTPLHHLLLREFGGPLVMTSGNLSEEPICIDNREALARLAGIADYFLVHDRDIYMRGDDSVVMKMAGRIRPLRRSRGYVPRPIPVNGDGPRVLAVGGELKNTVCLLKENQAFPSQHLGDIKNLEAFGFFKEGIHHLQEIFEVEPELVVHDLHPDYLSTRWAGEQGILPVLAVQHHHAHLASCLAENRHDGPAIGIILDGSGYGQDGTVWGGEILVGDFSGFTRYGCLEPMPLPGGDAAVKAPWRTAVAYLDMAFEGNLPELPFMADHDLGPIREMVRKNINSPLTSSCGRLFDAVAAMSGGRQTIAYEGQAAIELMEAAGRGGKEPAYRWDIISIDDILYPGLRALIRQVAEDVASGISQAIISRRFHRTLIEMLVGAAERVREQTGLDTVVLSGGSFNNYLLLEGLIGHLEGKGYNVLVHRQLPAGDGCLSLGQAVIGRSWLLNNHR